MRSYGKGSLSAATQVKVLSPEIILNAMGQGFHILEANIRTHAMGECESGEPGSKSAAGKRIVYSGTWENQGVPRSCKRAEDAIIQYVILVVGLTYSRGVNKVMLIEDNKVHSKGLAVICKKYCEKNRLSTEVDKVIHRNDYYLFSSYFYSCRSQNQDANLTGISMHWRNKRQIVRHITSIAEEPDVGNPQVRFCEGHGLSHLIYVNLN